MPRRLLLNPIAGGPLECVFRSVVSLAPAKPTGVGI
jgi:hypothetical protein